MKILVLMPLDEQHVVQSAEIERNLPEEVKEHCFTMPMFMQYLITTKTAKNWTWAFFDAIMSAEAVFKATDKDQDLIVIGNMPIEYKFDQVFNFQDAEHTKPYEDLFAAKLKEVCKDEPKLMDMLNNLHTAEESVFSLKNCAATAEFLASYLKTDPQIDKIKEKYKERLHFKDE